MVKFATPVWRNLRRSPRRTILTILAIALAAFTYSSLSSLPNVARRMLNTPDSARRIVVMSDSGFFNRLPDSYKPKILAAPHVTEEMWRALGHHTSVHLEPWPKFDPNLARDEMVTVVVQVNGKVRDRLQVPAGTSESEVRQLALNSEAVTRHLAGKTPTKFIFVKDRMLSIVT
jgi:hypothetical protein